jgi:hypothetical protein
MKEKITLLLFSITSLCSISQVAPFIDFNGYFRTFYHSNFRQLEFQRIQSFTAGDNMVAYIDNRGDFRIYDGEKVQTLTNQIVDYKLSDNQIAWKIGPTLFTLHEGEKKMLTTFANRYFVADSLIVFEDTRFNSINVFYNGEIIPLYTIMGDLYMPDCIGDNIIAFRENGDLYKIFWRGEIFELVVWSKPIKFHAGTDMIAFNDPVHRTFTVFENGRFVDVEDQFMESFKSGRGFAVYEDLNGNLIHYQNGKKIPLTNFSASMYDAYDDVVIWKENNFVYTLYNNEKQVVANYIPKDWKIKNGVFAFRNVMGGVSAYMNGKVHEITNQMNASYQIYGNVVLVELFNKSFIVLKNGKMFET